MHFLCITLLNKSDRSVVVTSFVLATKDHQDIYVKQDCVTGGFQYKREVRPGDKATFHIDATTFREIGRPASDYVSAIVHDAVGASYQSETEKLQRCIADLLKERQ